MSRTKTCRIAAALVGVVVLACACWAAQAKIKLIINGQTASTDVRVINGKAYAPIGDVAKALNMTVAKSGGAYKMDTAGGASQVSGSQQGKIGSEVFTGKWRFQVVSVETTDEYVERYYQAKRTIKPSGRGQRLVIVNCRIKNGMKKAKNPVLTERLPGNTGLACEDGQSYPPMDYDARQEADKTQSYAAASLIPGAGADFALVFNVPEDAKPKALVFSAMGYTEDVGGHGTDVRIELTQ